MSFQDFDWVPSVVNTTLLLFIWHWLAGILKERDISRRQFEQEVRDRLLIQEQKQTTPNITITTDSHTRPAADAPPPAPTEPAP